MIGRPDYGAGDLVVCVNDGRFTCEHGSEYMGKTSPPKLSVARVVGFVPSTLISGETCGCICAVLDSGMVAHSHRFRRIDPKPPEFFAGKIGTVREDELV